MLITCPKCSAKYQVPSEIRLKKGQKVQCSACEHIFEFVEVPPETKEEKVHLLPPEDAVLSVTTKEVVIQTKEAEDPASKKDSSSLPEAFRPVHFTNSSSRFPFGTVLLCVALLVCFVGMGWLWRDLLIMNTSFEQVFSLERKGAVPVRIHKMPLKESVAPKTHEEKASAATKSVVVDPVDDDEENLPFVPPVLPVVQSVRFRKTPTGAVLIEGTLKNTSSETVSVPEKVYALAYGEDGALLFEKEIYLPGGVLYPGMEQAFFGTYASVEKGVQWVDVVLKK